jgi:hypothetical protein
MPIAFNFGALVDESTISLNLQFISINFPNMLTDKNHSQKQFLSIIYGMSVIILLIYLLTDKVC